jgi:hypothetical protein
MLNAKQVSAIKQGTKRRQIFRILALQFFTSEKKKLSTKSKFAAS